MRRIGKFEVLAQLGAGAMGTVYQARDPVLDRLIALKTVSPGLLSQAETWERFQREARAAARLQHPNIVTIYELGEVDGTLYIAMELLEGMDLTEAMAVPGRLSLERKLHVVVDLCAGLDYAHKRGVVHRDVKPANVRVLPSGAIKIVDFGIARLADSNMTQTGIVLGTPSYIAPEVLAGGRVDHRTDMWATGVILYELLSGRRPFAGPTFSSLAYKVIHEPLPALDAVSLGLAPSLVNVVGRALAKDPAERFPDMAEMGAALQSILGVAAPAPALTPEMRQRACGQHLEEARRRLAGGDVEAALMAARRARALEPSRAEVWSLLEDIEERLHATSPPGGSTAETVDLPPAAAGRPEPPAPPPAPATRPAPARPRPLPSSWRDQGAFGEPPSVQASALSPTADVLALAGSDGAIRLWDLPARARRSVLRSDMHLRTGHDARGLCLAFSPDGALLASGHVDGSVHLWSLLQEETVPVRLRHEGMVATLGFSPDGKVLASGGLDANLKLWDVQAALLGEARRELHRQPAGVTALAWTGDSASLLTGHVNRVLRLLDARSGRLIASFRGPEAQVGVITLAPDRRRVAVASHDRSVRLFDTVSRTALLTFTAGQRRPVVAQCFLAEGTVLATVSLEDRVQLWNPDSGASVGSLWGATEDTIAGVAAPADGQSLVTALADGRIRTWGPSDRH